MATLQNKLTVNPTDQANENIRFSFVGAEYWQKFIALDIFFYIFSFLSLRFNLKKYKIVYK